MDYKYIEQLLDRYWQGETTVEEESILRSFFAQEEVPEGLARYQALFQYQVEAGKEKLGADFDQRLWARLDAPVVQAKRRGVRMRLAPFYRAASVVAILLTLSYAAQRLFENNGTAEVNYNYASYQDTYTDPQVAYEHVSSALRTVSDGLRRSGLSMPDTVLTEATISNSL